MPYAIYHDLPIISTAADVFAAVSQPEHLINWWPARCSGSPEVGSTYNFFFTPAYDWYGEVITCEPNNAFHIKMTQSDADWDLTSFGFDISPTESGVQLAFWHKNWAVCNAHYRRSSYCWAILLQGLKNYVEKGAVVPFEERE